MANFILVNNEKISIFTPSIITHYTVNSPCTLFILFCQISPYVIITWMSYSAHKSLPDCSIWVTKLLLIIVVRVVSKPSLTRKLASHFSSWIVQQLEVEVCIHLKWQVTFHFFEGFIPYDTYSHSFPFLNCCATLYMYAWNWCGCIIRSVQVLSQLLDSLGSLENLTGSIVNYQKFRCHNTLTCISFSSAHGWNWSFIHVLDESIQIEEGKRKRNLKRTSFTIMHRAFISSWVTFSCCLTAWHMYFLL